ncbi:DUF1819 family protein [Synechocystis salina LEGE 00031]|uniref:DUF1819 family protein n=2 Tax=Synechocystis TaxID=1142 RepID=A0ABR9VS40_9SYNC|nr:BrxA family protein [Synechocystis salina]MBE9253856.1 DUF1819 family protein [Synechocystis salina LEGE 00031]
MVKTVESLSGTLEKYDTTINVIGGIKDYSAIFKVINSYFDGGDSVNQLIYQRNEFNLRTDKSRQRIEKAIVKAFLNFKNPDHQQFVKGLLAEHIPWADKQMVLFWHFSLNNRLFREISIQVFAKIYHSGRVSINKNDIIAYLKDFIATEETNQISWSESTINTLATKYLNLMTKLRFLKPKRNKIFEEIKPSSQSLVVFLYFAKLFDPDDHDIFKNQFLPLLLIHHQGVVERLKKLAMRGFFNMDFNGVSLNIDLTYPYQEISNVLYR